MCVGDFIVGAIIGFVAGFSAALLVLAYTVKMTCP